MQFTFNKVLCFEESLLKNMEGFKGVERQSGWVLFNLRLNWLVSPRNENYHNLLTLK